MFKFPFIKQDDSEAYEIKEVDKEETLSIELKHQLLQRISDLESLVEMQKTLIEVFDSVKDDKIEKPPLPIKAYITPEMLRVLKRKKIRTASELSIYMSEQSLKTKRIKSEEDLPDAPTDDVA